MAIWSVNMDTPPEVLGKYPDGRFGPSMDFYLTDVLLSVLLYQMMVYYNQVTGRPLRALKHMLGS
jgi:hypothetical protein